jgi:hypothetical protein
MLRISEFAAVNDGPLLDEDQLEPAQWWPLAVIPAYTATRPEIVIDPGPITDRFYRLVTPMR